MLLMAEYVDGPLDGYPPASLDDWHDGDPVPPRVVYVQHPHRPGAGVVWYGAALDELAAPVEGQPPQHTYDLDEQASPPTRTIRVKPNAALEVPPDALADPARLAEWARDYLARDRTAAPQTARVLTYRYRGVWPTVPMPDAELPLAGKTPGPVRLACPGRCVIPFGLDVTELRDDDEHELDVIGRAHGCPEVGCGRLFLVEPTRSSAVGSAAVPLR